MIPDTHVEPWLRGPRPHIPPLAMPLFHSFLQVREDVRKHLSGLSPEQIWRKPDGGGASVGFHLKHMAGSVDRLLTYLEDRQLTHGQLAFLQVEHEGPAGFDELYRMLDRQLSDAEQRLLQLDYTALTTPRYVGRQRLEVTFIGLLVHIAEHTQRHLGQAITTGKVVSACV